MAPLTTGTAAMTPTRIYSRSSLGPPGMNSALLNTAWMSSGLTMPIVEVSTIRPTTTALRPGYGRNSGIPRRAVSRPIPPLSHRRSSANRGPAGLPAGPPLRDLPVRDPEDHDGGELDRLAGRRLSEHGAGVGAVQGPPDRDPVCLRDQVVDGEAQVGVGAVLPQRGEHRDDLLSDEAGHAVTDHGLVRGVAGDIDELHRALCRCGQPGGRLGIGDGAGSGEEVGLPLVARAGQHHRGGRPD